MLLSNKDKIVIIISSHLTKVVHQSVLWKMKFSRVDVCATVVIVACLSYLLWDHGASEQPRNYPVGDAELTEDPDSSGEYVHGTRNCPNNSLATNVIIVDLSYSKFTLLEELLPIEGQSTGDGILKAFITVSFKVKY